MSKDVRSRTILSKKYGLELLKRGFSIIDIQPSKKKPGEIAFVFEQSQELDKEFQALVYENRVTKRLFGLTPYDIRTLLGTLQNYPISDKDRFDIMEKLQVIDDMICDGKAPAPEHEDINEEIEEVVEKIAEVTKEKLINIENLKDAMTGCK